MQEALEAVERREEETSVATAAGQPDTADKSSEAPEPPSTPSPEVGQPPAKEIEDLRDRLLRMAADFDNFRKRARRELEDARRYGIDSLLHDIVPVADNLARALAHASQENSPLVEGVRMVSRQFEEVLKGHGVTGFASVGEPFDPERHEAVTQQESSTLAPGSVIEELQKGYMLHDRLLRPARVVVAVPQQNANNTEQADQPTKAQS